MSNSSEVQAVARKEQGRGWTPTWDVLRDVVIQYRDALDLYEREVLFFIFCRTRMYNKQWEAIPLRHFLFGVYSRNGLKIIDPVDMCEKRLLTCLKHLRGKGMIEARREAYGAFEYRIKLYDEIDRDRVNAYLNANQRRLLNRWLIRFGGNNVIRRDMTRDGVEIPSRFTHAMCEDFRSSEK